MKYLDAPAKVDIDTSVGNGGKCGINMDCSGMDPTTARMAGTVATEMDKMQSDPKYMLNQLDPLKSLSKDTLDSCTSPSGCISTGSPLDAAKPTIDQVLDAQAKRSEQISNDLASFGGIVAPISYLGALMAGAENPNDYLRAGASLDQFAIGAASAVTSSSNKPVSVDPKGEGYIPKVKNQETGNPSNIPLELETAYLAGQSGKAGGTDIPLPDSTARGPHTTIGGRVGINGEVYRQTQLFLVNPGHLLMYKILTILYFLEIL